MDFFLDCLMDAVHDTWTMLPLLYIAYLVIEYFTRRPVSDDTLFCSLQKWGPAFGALLGLLPQCGFSILAAMLYAQGFISMGTLVAVFVATSDEAIPILLSEPTMIKTLGVLLVCKLVIAMIAGMIIDKLILRHQKLVSIADIPEEEEEDEPEGAQEEDELEEDETYSSECPCCYPQYPIWLSSLLRTLKIFAFIFITTLVLNLLLGSIGEETLSSILLSGSIFQPVLASLFGFIPNCAATVILCQLYVFGKLSFASLLAGLETNAGLGLMVLFNLKTDKKKIAQIFLFLLATALISGYLVMAIKAIL